MRAVTLLILAALLVPGAAAAQDTHSPYAHEGSDRVKTLTQEEVDGLLAGEGMGLARPAEMNGYPGPRHVLDMADSLRLTPEQRDGARAIFEAMQDGAQALGRRVLEVEEALDSLFASGAVAEPVLEEKVGEAARLQGELRLVHLRAHLEMRALLTPHQIHEYGRLRGYAGAHAH